MTPTQNTYYILCPANYVSGGPEALHQLVSALRSLGRKAFICYYPFDAAQIVPQAFSHYGIDSAFPQDTIDETIIVPEAATGMLRRFKRAHGAVWWLSVDYYFAREYHSALLDAMRRIRYILTRRNLSLRQMRAYSHYCQSAYAAAFVASHGLHSMPLSDYSRASPIAQAGATARVSRVLYNPKKGFATTRRLIKACPDIEFMPLVGLSREEVQNALASSKLYVDFGQHPGRDRMPREAAAAGCCVITGRRGSASFPQDVPIPERYKLDESIGGFEAAFRIVVNRVFTDFERYERDFDSYRAIIAGEKDRFISEVEAAFE